MAQITCKDVALGYEGKIVTGAVNFEVNKGEYLCILGENGTGKSTLMKAILGLTTPMEGKIVFSDGIRQKEIGYLPQQTPRQRDFPASVQEIVLTGFLGGMGLRPFYTREEKEKSVQIMEKLGILSLAKQCYRDLSGGQQQRVLLARALCATGKMILLDEPVAGLDPKATEELYDLIREINQKEEITILMVSHDIQAALRDASHILHLSDRPLFFGTREDYAKSGLLPEKKHIWEEEMA